MEGSNWPIILIELVLVAGGVGGFCWWQLRSVKRDQEKSRAERARARQATQEAPDDGKKR